MTTMRDDRGWIQTASGKRAWPLDPRVEDIDIQDIAHALSNICRYTGHTRNFYSVGEHSVRVSWIVPPEHALWGLLHDASEAYLSDIARPVKQHPEFGPMYKKFEKRLMDVICEKFGLDPTEPPCVKEADNILLVTERRDLMATPPRPWSVIAEPLAERIVPWSPIASESVFMRRFRKLTAASDIRRASA